MSDLTRRQQYKLAALKLVSDYDLHAASGFFHDVDVPNHGDIAKAASTFAARIADEMILEDAAFERSTAP